MSTQPRERAAPCSVCWTRTRRTTWNTNRVCDACALRQQEVEAAPTQTALDRWHRDHTGGDAA